MYSTSKVNLDKSTIARWSQKHLGKTLVDSREITSGWFNSIYVLKLDDGSQSVLKVSPPPSFKPMRYERDILKTEIAVHRRLFEKGLPVPRVQVDCPDGDGIGHAWFIMEFIEGESWDELRKNQPLNLCDYIDTVIAKQVVLVNEIKGERFGRWTEDHCSSSSWVTSFLSMVKDLLADARDKSLSLPMSDKQLLDLINTFQKDLDLVKIPQLVLWDLHDGNVIVKTEPLELAAFVDTDRALWGDPLMEFYFRSLANSSETWKTAYQTASNKLGKTFPPDRPGAARRMVLYDLYLALVLVIESVYRNYGPDHQATMRNILNQTLEKCKTV